MQIESIQVGLPTTYEFRGRSITTAINKEPIPGPVRVEYLNIVGDKQADLRVHGGSDKAVYAYGVDALNEWKSLRPTDKFGYGGMGENLSVDVLKEDEVFVGDLFRIGSTEMLAVQPRLPCFKLAFKYDDQTILRQFMSLKRPGVYFRVVKEGEINTGDKLELIDREGKVLSITSMFDFVTHHDEPSPQLTKEILKLKSLPKNWTEHFEAYL